MAAPVPFTRRPVKRVPRETTARMGDLATLPVFLKLRGKTALVAGGSVGTAWKAELLAAAGAQVRLVWNQPDAEAIKLAAEWPERVTLIRRALQDEDFDGIAIAIGALEDDAEGAHFAATARAKGIPVNVVDKPAFCDFQFGAIVNRSPLVIGISTDGGAPPLGQAIRSMIETLLPAGLARWAAAAKNWRGRVMSAGLDGADRRAFWRRFAAEAMARPNEAPCPVEREAMIVDLEHRDLSAGKGHLALVGAGPGDPELLTLKAVRYLREADVILYDDLVSDGVLAFGRREARKIHVGKRGGEVSCAQKDITSLAVLLAQEGNRVVRLKGGDPLIFGRADEEIRAASEAGVSFTIVNGISAAQGAAAALGASLTRRGVARRLQFVTAHAETGQLPASIDWGSVADLDVTTCIYMGRRNLGEFLSHAFAAGLDRSTPARFVINATLPDQHVLAGDAQIIGAMVAECDRRGPGVLMLGYAFGVVNAVVRDPMRLAAE
jgi:uroporphyrin-III C-methyltransferase / precorrin-2 dehydrogenase / sirohydrochlorin ferrochelatase